MSFARNSFRIELWRCGGVSLDERGRILECLPPFLQHRPVQMPYMEHFLPDRNLGIDTGRNQRFVHRDSIAQKAFAVPDLDQRWRQP